MSTFLRYALHSSQKVPKSKPNRRSVSHASLRQKMSELISLREQVAQAELAINDAVTGNEPDRTGDSESQAPP